MTYLLICRSLTYAQRSVQVLERAGISAALVRVPQELALEGCGYGIRIKEKWLSRALVLLHDHSLSPKRIYLSGMDGELREVRV